MCGQHHARVGCACWLMPPLAAATSAEVFCTHAAMGLAGTLMKPEEVERAAALCAEAGAWLVLDNTCELPCRAAAGSQLA